MASWIKLLVAGLLGTGSVLMNFGGSEPSGVESALRGRIQAPDSGLDGPARRVPTSGGSRTGADRGGGAAAGLDTALQAVPPRCGAVCGAPRPQGATESLGAVSLRRAWESLAWLEGEEARSALDTLLFHGAELAAWLDAEGFDGSGDHGLQSWLRSEVSRPWVQLELRVRDDRGGVPLAWGPVPVRLGEKRHIAPTHLEGLAMPDTSGRVERVGVDHYWLRW